MTLAVWYPRAHKLHQAAVNYPRSHSPEETIASTNKFTAYPDQAPPPCSAYVFSYSCSISVLGTPQKTLIDEIAGSATIFFLISSVLSYASMKSKQRPFLYEEIADIAFFTGLLFLTSVSIIIVLGLLR